MDTYTASSPFEGSWDVTHATLPNGEFAYTGRIRIQQSAATFQLVWDISAGNYVGIGLVHDDHLFVSCGEQYAGLGVALYTHRSESTPTIQWSTAELAGSVGTGTFATPWSGTFEGDHHLVQYLPNGQIYGEWTLSIHKVDAIYQLSWRKGDTIHFKGLGLATPQGLAIGWYPDVSQIAFLDYRTDPHHPQRLHAIWALGGYTTLGTETLTRV
jgi:hypothetical protein